MAQRVVLVAIALGIALLAAAVGHSPTGRLAHVYQTGTQSFHYPVTKTLAWYGADLFVVVIAAGWVIFPGAVLGLRRLVTSADPRRKALGFLTLILLGGLLLEAAPFGANGSHVEERYAFYGAPLIVAAFAVAWEHGLLHGRALWYLTGLVAAVAVLLPIDGPLVASGTDESPTLYGLGQLASAGAIVWAPLLAAAAILSSLRRAGAWTLGLAACLCIVTSAGASWNLVRTSERAPDVRAGAPSGSSVVTWQGADPYVLMRTLFWNPGATRVLVLGPGVSPDGYPFESAKLAPGPRIETVAGRAVSGPYVFTRDGLVFGGGRHAVHGQTTLVERTPRVIAFGWDGQTGWFGPGGGASIYAAGGTRPSKVVVGLRTTDREGMILRIQCDYGLDRVVNVGVRAAVVAVPIARRRPQTCVARLLKGRLTLVAGRPATLRGRLALRED
jgi:hypothetical protein